MLLLPLQLQLLLPLHLQQPLVLQFLLPLFFVVLYQQGDPSIIHLIQPISLEHMHMEPMGGPRHSDINQPLQQLALDVLWVAPLWTGS
jgi:hypothetical protein